MKTSKLFWVLAATAAGAFALSTPAMAAGSMGPKHHHRHHHKHHGGHHKSGSTHASGSGATKGS